MMNYTYIYKQENLCKAMAWLTGRSFFVFDVETGPRPEYIKMWEENPKIGLDPHYNQIVTVQVGDKNEQFIIDTRTVNIDAILELLRDPSISVVGVGLKYDIKMMMHHYKCRITAAVDVMIIEQIIRNGIFPVKEQAGNTGGATRRYTSMKALSKRYLDIDIDKDLDLRITLWKTPPGEFDKRQLDYMAGDCVYPELILRKQKPIAVDRGLLKVIKLENELIPVVANMELVGLPLDTGRWITLLQEATEARIKYERELDKYFGHVSASQGSLFGDDTIIRTINYDSPKQLAKALHKFGVSGFVSTDGKELSTATPKIVKMKIRGQIDSKLADTIMEFRKAIQRETSYGENFLKKVHPKTGRIHPDYTQCCLVTGRMSASPGVQTIPRDPRYRASFVAPPGYTFIILDASQIEARLSCDTTQDLEGIRVFQADGDIYKEDGQKFYNRAIDKSTPEGQALRDKAKSAWLGLTYGQGKRNFHDWSTVFLGEDISKKDTDYLFDKFFEIHHQMKVVMDGWSALANPETSNRFVVDEIVSNFIDPERMFNRLVEFYSFRSKGDEAKAHRRAKELVNNRNQLRYAETLLGRKRFFRPDYLGWWTAARNMPIQGTAADAQKATLLAYQKMHWEEGFDADVILVVHDELVTLVKEDQAERLYERQVEVGNAVGQKFLKNIPMKIEGGIAKTWLKF